MRDIGLRMRNARLPELDALRGIAIVAVVGLHVSFGFLLAAPTGMDALAALAVHVLTTFGTPLFLALSMAGLALGYPRPLDLGPTYRAFLVRRARRVLPPYVLWTLLILLRDDPAAIAAPPVLARHLATGSAAFHLYFVPLIFEYYLLWPLLARAGAAARRSTSAAYVIAAGGLATTLLVWRAAAAGWMSNGILMLPLFFLGYATLGVAVAPQVAERPRSDPRTAPAWLPWIALTAATATFAFWWVRGLVGATPDDLTITIATTIFQAPMMAYALSAMGLAVVLVAGPARGTRLLQALGRASYGIYLSHVLVLGVVLRRMFGRADAADFTTPAWAFAMVFQWILCLALSYGLVRAMERVPALAPFAGGTSDRALTPPAPAP